MKSIPFSVGFGLQFTVSGKATLASVTDSLATLIASGFTLATARDISKRAFTLTAPQGDTMSALLGVDVACTALAGIGAAPAGFMSIVYGTTDRNAVANIARRVFNFGDTFARLVGSDADAFGGLSPIDATAQLWEALAGQPLPVLVATMNADDSADYTVDLRSLARDGTMSVRHLPTTLDSQTARDWLAFNVEFATVAVNQARLLKRNPRIVETDRQRMVKALRAVSGDTRATMLAWFKARTEVTA
jgi:hypothetical protein